MSTKGVDIDPEAIYVDGIRFVENPFVVFYMIPSNKFMETPEAQKLMLVTKGEMDHLKFTVPYKISRSLTIHNLSDNIIDITEVYTDLLIWLKYLRKLDCEVLHYFIGERVMDKNSKMLKSKIFYHRNDKETPPCL